MSSKILRITFFSFLGSALAYATGVSFSTAAIGFAISFLLIFGLESIFGFNT